MSNASQVTTTFINRNQSLAIQVLTYAGVPASFSSFKKADNRAGLAAYLLNLEGSSAERARETARVIEACGGDPRPGIVDSMVHLSGVQQAFLNTPPPPSPLPSRLPPQSPTYSYIPAQTSTFISSLDMTNSQSTSGSTKKEKTKKEEEKEKDSTSKQASPTPITLSETTRQNIVTENMFISTISHLQQTTGLETEALIPVATRICAARVSLPDITTNELTDFIDTQIPYLETQGFRVNSLNSSTLATHLHDFNLDATGPELVDQTVQAELTRSGLSLDHAHQLSPAATGFYDQVYQISGHVSRLDAPAQTISPQERHALNYQSQQLTDYLSFTHSEASTLIPHIDSTQVDHSRVHATQEAVYGSPQNYSLTVDTPPQDYLIYLQNLQRTGVNLPAPLQATLQNYLNTPQGQEIRLDYLRPSLNSNPITQRIYSNTDWGLSPSQAFNYNLANHPSTVLGRRIFSPITRPLNTLNSRVLSPVATRVASTTAGKAATAIATKVGIKAALQAVGSAVPVVGNVVAFVAGEIASKVIMKIGKFLKDNVGPIIGGLAGLSFGAFGGFGVMGVAVSGGVGAAGGAFTSAALTGTTSALTSSVSGYASSALSGVAAAVGAGISGTAKSALIACFLLPIIVTLTIFIINAGATVVPPANTNLSSNPSIGTVGESQYMQVVKTPYIQVGAALTPVTQPLNNSNLPTTITYRVAITAKQYDLTNFTLNNQYQVIQSPSTAPIPVATVPVPPGFNVRANTTQTLEYQVTFSTAYRDSLVVDNLTVSATANSTTDSVTAVATVIFGTPPTNCFVFDSSWASVPNFKSKLMTQLFELTSRHPNYVARICGGGITYIGYRSGSVHNGFCASNPGNVCYFYEGLLSSADSYVYYTLTHELGHRLNWVSSALFDQFVTTVLCQPGETTGCEAQLPSYACFHNGAHSTTEDFAETAAWYTEYSRYNDCPNVGCNCYNRLNTDWPLHYNFAVSQMF